MTTIQQRTADRLYDEAEPQFERWDAVREIIDEASDLALNYRQSGHPGGSRSKVHLFLALLLSGAMRWDIRKPWRPFADRFVLSAGHTVPLFTPPRPNEVLRARAERTLMALRRPTTAAGPWAGGHAPPPGGLRAPRWRQTCSEWNTGRRATAAAARQAGRQAGRARKSRSSWSRVRAG
jgi:hypothetical protein